MKPKTDKEIEQWNAGARQADSTWWQADTSGGWELVGGRYVDEGSAYLNSHALQARSKRDKDNPL